MAAEMVVWENLKRTLESERVRELPFWGKLEQLKSTVERVKGALIALEAEEHLDSEVTPSRLDHVVALLHESDDLLDSILTITRPSRPAIIRGGQAILSCQTKLSLWMKMAGPLSRINQGIGEVVKELEHKFSSDTPEKLFNPPPCQVAVNELVGRDKEMDDIIKKILRPKNMSSSNVSVIPVWGLSGLGKSVLVWSVYNDEKVKSHFDLRMWIHVSGISDEGEIIREILDSCTSRKSNYRNPQSLGVQQSHQNKARFLDVFGCQSLVPGAISPGHRATRNEEDIIERRLKKQIDGKLYLLVLDDASIRQWSRLKDLLANGAIGSQVLVTTNSRKVADLAKTENNRVYELPGLEFKESWSLFKTSALGLGDFEDSEWENIGKSIAKSCEGIPLMVRVAGGLLCGKSKEQWSSFNNDITFSGEDIREVRNRILEHSYNDLPYRLKACIGYCSLFPEDYDFDIQDLISLWIAQGFVDPQDGLSSEDAGEKYFLELSRRYFFHQVSKDVLGNNVTCKMHPLIHKLAHRKAARVANIYIGDKDVSNIPDSKYKHVSLSCDTESVIKVPPSLLRAESLRTLLSVKEPDCGAKIDGTMCSTLISKFECLRVLDLHDLGIEELPESISNLIHLRYLDLSKNDLVTLPRSVTKLYNLQTLKLNSCSKLSKLEGNFSHLVNLKRFELDECYSLNIMPLGLDRLTQLEVLSRFVVGKGNSLKLPTVGLQALKLLNNLKSRLEIELTGDWIENIEEGTQADLKEKSHLEEIKISWAQQVSDDARSSLLAAEEKLCYQELLEELQPHKNLKVLCIEGYKGDDFPSWVMASGSLPNLVVISIEGCDKCQDLPSFGALPFLKRLTLRHMANVKYVESKETSSISNQEALQMSSPLFVSLEELTLHNFYKLKRWRKEMMSTSRRGPPVPQFPKLAKLRIWNCPKLVSMPLFAKVIDLDLRNVDIKLLEECAKKQRTKTSGIKHLKIKGCANLSSFTEVTKGLGQLPQLEQLVINGCDGLTSMVSEFRYLSSLKQLEISGCKELDLSESGSFKIGSSDMTSWVSLRRIQNLPLLRNLQHEEIPWTPWTSLKGLRELTIKDIPKMRALPEGLKHVATLKILRLSTCNDLQELPQWISSLTALQQLKIESCPAVKRMPEGIKAVNSLMNVEISGCPELMERCKEHIGEDWPKIKHARVLLHKSWRYDLNSEARSTLDMCSFNVTTFDDAKYLVIPVLPVGKG